MRFTKGSYYIATLKTTNKFSGVIGIVKCNCIIQYEGAGLRKYDNGLYTNHRLDTKGFIQGRIFLITKHNIPTIWIDNIESCKEKDGGVIGIARSLIINIKKISKEEAHKQMLLEVL
jgi:hypothetical protein